MAGVDEGVWDCLMQENSLENTTEAQTWCVGEQKLRVKNDSREKKQVLMIVKKCIYWIHSFGTSIIIIGHTVNIKQKWASQYFCSWRVM